MSKTLAFNEAIRVRDGMRIFSKNGRYATVASLKRRNGARVTIFGGRRATTNGKPIRSRNCDSLKAAIRRARRWVYHGRGLS